MSAKPKVVDIVTRQEVPAPEPKRESGLIVLGFRIPWWIVGALLLCYFN